MKTLLSLILLSLAWQACKTEAELPRKAIYGKWKLTETLADPGDGSGTWTKVTDYRYTQFNKDGSIEGTAVSNTTTFKVLNDSTLQMTITSNNSNPTTLPLITYRYNIAGKQLILTPPCIEACGLKFIKEQ